MSFLTVTRSAAAQKKASSLFLSTKGTRDEAGVSSHDNVNGEYGAEPRMMEGSLWVRVHSRRPRYCVLQGRTLHVYNSKEDALTSEGQLSPSSKKKIVVIGVKDAIDLDKQTRQHLLGGETNGTVDNVLVISTLKSKLVVVEAETQTEKQRWLHAMSCLNFASEASEKTFFLSLLQDKDSFDAHTAVSLLHRYRDNALATGLIIDRLAEYAEHHIDDVEFYIQQIMHLVVNLELTKTDKLVNLLLSICKAKAYVEHLGNCIHLALQLFWLLEAKIQDNDPKTYNTCAKLLMSIEANVVNQQFELTPANSSPESISIMLMKISGMKERIGEMKRAATVSDLNVSDATFGMPQQEDQAPTVKNRTHDYSSNPTLSDTDSKMQRELLMQWMEKERQKRYKYFHEQRDFIKALTDISEKMRSIEPPTERKKHLPVALEQLVIPPMAYVPLGRVSDPFSRITRVLKDEDQINAAGQRASFSRPSTGLNSSRKSSALSAQVSASNMSISIASYTDEEAEVAAYIKKFSFKGNLVCVDTQHPEEDERFDEEVEQVATMSQEDTATEEADIYALERHLNITSEDSSSTAANLEQNSRSSIDSGSIDNEPEDQRKLIRHRSRAAYEYSLSKLMNESSAFGERWKAKKERIRASSPYGNLPGWDVISLISKSNDDIRQEVFAMQLITKFQDIFKESNIPLWLRPYRIISTGKTCGLIETLTDAQSLDSLKKRQGYTSLRSHFERTYGGGHVDTKAFKTAQRNFLQSLVAYSLVCYLLQIKDRHNGNIMLDTEGHLIHIDFGFMLGTAPGGNWSIETAPFKLTKEMVEVLGGHESKAFGEFVHLFSRGMLAAQRSAEKIITLVEIMMRNSTFPCFQGRDVSKDLQKLRDRFMLNSSTEETVKGVMKLINSSYKNKWTKRYDQFQKLTNGILP